MLKDALAVEVVVSGLDPEAPVEEAQELNLKKIHFFEVDSADVGHEVVPVEDVVVELRGQEGRSENQPI